MINKIVEGSLRPNLIESWKGCAVHKESTLHQLSPYIGKIKSSMAKAIIQEFTRPGDTVYDPFSGSGTVALEAWAARRNIVASDLSPYAYVLTNAKLFPASSLDDALAETDLISNLANPLIPSVDLRRVPKWVRSFFHPETLREAIAWSELLTTRRSYFLLACLLGILHHQRPGFLSFPSSHAVPYLRQRKFPPTTFPDLYEYRPLRLRLENKVRRAFRRIPELSHKVSRSCYMRDAGSFFPNRRIDAIITSPPYMGQLAYGRDNRLRLWFLGISDWKSLDHIVSPLENDFFALLTRCLNLWHELLPVNGRCIFVLGDAYSRMFKMSLPNAIRTIAIHELRKYSLVCSYVESIPDERRVRRNYRGNLSETILVLRKRG